MKRTTRTYVACGLLVLGLLMLTGLQFWHEQAETFYPAQIFCSPADESMAGELYGVSSLQNEPGVLGICNPDSELQQRLFPDLRDYDRETERVLWCYQWRPDGEVTVHPEAVQVWGAAQEGHVWYFVIPEEYVIGRTKLLHEDSPGPKRKSSPRTTT